MILAMPNDAYPELNHKTSTAYSIVLFPCQIELSGLSQNLQRTTATAQTRALINDDNQSLLRISNLVPDILSGEKCARDATGLGAGLATLSTVQASSSRM